MKVPKYVILVTLLFQGIIANAQDPVLSQFFANRSYLNPAFTGLEEGLQVSATARNQWYAADQGYTFLTTTAEWQEPCWNSGFGIAVTHAQEGLAPMNASSAGLMYSYVIPSGRNNWHFGLKYTFNQKQLDWSKLTFSDQLDPVFGNIYGSAVTPGNESVFFHDFAFGVVRRWDSKTRTNHKHQYSTRSHIGLAINHMASLFGVGPDESFLGTGSEVPARITLHGGTIIPLEFLRGVGRQITLSPNFRFESQGPNPLNPVKSLTLFSGGLYVIFLNQFTTGVLYHTRAPLAGAKHTNALTLAAGFSNQPKKQKKDSFYFGLSVDVNTSGLGIRSNNVYELNIRYAFRGLKNFCDRGQGKGRVRPKGRSLECPHFDY